tara:strand:- start:194 stop:409 length:216 start_codon:yes stop_codon:yes gene_type:complete
MKYLIVCLLFNIFLIGNVYSVDNQKCVELDDKPKEYAKCIAQKSKELGKKGIDKLNTDSKLTDWIKKKIGK